MPIQAPIHWGMRGVTCEDHPTSGNPEALPEVPPVPRPQPIPSQRVGDEP
jgi:hypothetical protein